MRDRTLLYQLQALPLEAKTALAEQRIMEWYRYFNGNVYVSYSGGKDSTVLAHIVHKLYPDVPLVFSNTGLEYPEIRKFAKLQGAEIISPEMQFDQVISTYGYPIISKEVAEAIHYARKIVSDNEKQIEGGGTTHRERSRADLRGKRRYTSARSHKMAKSKSYKHIAEDSTRSQREENSQNFMGGGYSIQLRRIKRFRQQLLGKKHV